MKKLLFWLKRLFRSKRTRQLEKLAQVATEKVSVREAERVILKDKIIKSVRKYLKLDAKSKYIPLSLRNKEEIRFQVESEFGEQLEALDMRLTENLRVVPNKMKR